MSQAKGRRQACFPYEKSVKNDSSHPDPGLRFVVEVDASDSEVVTTLLQVVTAVTGRPEASSLRLLLLPRLTPAERNYDVVNRELLALMLQEWRHWLEGAAHPCLV